MEILELFKINPLLLEYEYKARELSKDRVNTPYAVRLDGVAFGKALSDIKNVRDPHVHRALVSAAKTVMRHYGASIGFVSSDEINLIFTINNPFAGRVQKITTVLAGLVSAHVSLSLGRTLYFDARIVKLDDIDDIVRYVKFRMRVTGGNYISSLYRRKTGIKKFPSIFEMLEAVGYNHPDYALYGTCIIPATVEKTAVNPITGQTVTVERRRLTEVSGYRECETRLRRFLSGEQR